ncbi:hypothetical protein ACO4C2_05380 [Streptococcus equinus]|uniref:hypothetical protein n=1 Tax=Streptococcus equinus TaxID=1335 RepID=UPI003C6FC270
MLETVGIIVMLAFIVAAIYTVHAKLLVTKNFGYDYVVVVKDGVTLPDLASNAHLKGKVRVVGSSDDTCSVQSHLNDVELKKIVMADYHLSDEQVSIRPAQLSGALGMM